MEKKVKKIVTGQSLYNQAKKIIPGGTMLLSKRPEMFLPENWPSYFSKAKGHKIWDLNGNVFEDFSMMGVGTNSLGYANSAIDKAVLKTIKSGNMSTLNNPEEVKLAEMLIALNPWAEMVRFARTGGEANSIGIRIARSAAQKENVAFCGYHGWHDWYLSSNIQKQDTLNTHLLSGLDTSGVPNSLSGTSFGFRFNDFSALEKLVNEKDIGVIKMEVQRSDPPENNFLHNVRKLASKKNIILIFDECTSGFRETNTGLYKKYNIEPDIAIYGKALGNGYAITAVVGKRDIMEHAQKSFISSTFWTERIGPTAAISTLNHMQEIKSWEIITELGKYVKSMWKEIAVSNGFKIKIGGIDPIPVFSFDSPRNLYYKTFITQEMLKKSILASNAIYLSTCHSKKLLDKYFHEFDSILKHIKKIEENGDIVNFLDGPVCHSGFERLN